VDIVNIRTSRHPFPALLCLILLLLVPRAVAAQRLLDAGQVHIRLASEGPDVPISISSEAGRISIVGSRALIQGLAPGTYLLTVGGLTATVTVNPREIVVLQQRATTLDVVDRQTVGEGLHVTSRWVTDPASSHDVWSLVETTAPFVVADRMDNGGLATGRTALLGSRGASWTTTRVTFGGATIVGPNIHGLMPFALDLAATQAVSVVSGMAPVEYGTPGVVVALTPRAPATTRRGAFEVSLTTPGMVTTNALPWAPSIQRTDNWQEANLIFDTPLGARTGVLVSGTRSRIQFFERGRPDLWTSAASTLMTHLVHRPNDTNQLRVIGALQRVSSPYDDRRQLRDRAVVERGTFWQLSSTWDRTVGSGAHLEGLAAASGGAFTPDVTDPEGGTLDRVTDGFVPAPVTRSRATQFEVGATLHASPRRVAGAFHDLRVGGTVRRGTLRADTLATLDVAEVVAGLPARVWRPDAPATPSRRSMTEAALFVADRISLGNNLTIEAGVRAEFTRGTIRGASQGISWTTVSPRFSAQWQHGPIALFAGSGTYTEPLAFSQFRHGDPGEVTFDVHRWTDADGDRRFSEDETGVLLARAGRGAGVASIDPALKAPRTIEHTTGLEMRFGKHFSIRTAFIWRKQRSLLGSVNTGVPVTAYDQRLIPDAGEDWDGPSDDGTVLVYDRRPESFGLDTYLLTNPADATAKYEGIEQMWMLRTRPVEMLFGAMAYRTRSWSGHLGFGPLENDYGVIGEVFERPNARPLVQGSYFFDRSYVGKWAGTVHLPKGVHFGFAARYQDGQPFARVIVVPDLATGPEMIHAYRVARTRYTYTLTLDMRLQKSFAVGGGTVAVRLDVFNATQHTNEVEEDALTTPNFRLSSAVQPPLTFRLGMRVGW
jgi:hypothetical protein